MQSRPELQGGGGFGLRLVHPGHAAYDAIAFRRGRHKIQTHYARRDTDDTKFAANDIPTTPKGRSVARYQRLKERTRPERVMTATSKSTQYASRPTAQVLAAEVVDLFCNLGRALFDPYRPRAPLYARARSQMAREPSPAVANLWSSRRHRCALLSCASMERDMIRPRTVALSSTLVVMVCSIEFGFLPVFLLHAVTLPINAWRLWRADAAF